MPSEKNDIYESLKMLSLVTQSVPEITCGCHLEFILFCFKSYFGMFAILPWNGEIYHPENFKVSLIKLIKLYVFVFLCLKRLYKATQICHQL